MSRILFSLLILFTTLAAAAQPVPVVTDIQPSQGPSGGGTEVVIRRDNLSTPVQCLLPCPPRVVFGGTAVDALAESDKRLVVTTPAHAPGKVDVEIDIPGRPILLVKDAFTFRSDADDDQEQVLLPIYIKDTVPGANGTQWRTDFRIRNDGTATERLAPWDCPVNQACPPVFPLTFPIQPRQTLHNPVDFARTPGTNPSRLLYITAPNQVSMNLRVADASHSTLNGGTDLPVIRPGEMLEETAQLFNVPMTDPNFRMLLRVYEVAYSKASFIVRLYPEDTSNEAAVHTELLIATTPQTGVFRSEAAYAQLDLGDLLKLRSVWPANVRIEIEPVTPGSRYWAFVSITSNQTQLVTLV